MEQKRKQNRISAARKPCSVLAMIFAYFYVGGLGWCVGWDDGVPAELNYEFPMHKSCTTGKSVQEIPGFMIPKQ